MTQKDLFMKLAHLQWLFHKKQMGVWLKNRLADTTSGQGRILALLKLKDGVSTKDLAYLLGVRVSSLNELLSKMEKAGLLTREPSNEDKRVMLVILTEKGKNARQEGGDSAFENMFACLTEEEQQTLGALLDRLIEAFYANSDESEQDLFERPGRFIRERFNDFEAFFREGGHMMRGGHGFAHGHRPGFDRDGRPGFGRERNPGFDREAYRHTADKDPREN